MVRGLLVVAALASAANPLSGTCSTREGNCLGNDLFIVSGNYWATTPSAEVCCTACQNYAGCVAAVYTQNGQYRYEDTCFLKSSCNATARQGNNQWVLTPAVCTAWNKDPYATGAHVSCCDGLQEGLGNWDGDGNIYYKCRQATTLGVPAESGTMTVGTAVVGASCEYANSQNGGLNSPAATSPYVKSNHFCAANPAKFAGGAGCGECFKVTYGGSGGTNPGVAGSAVVQVVNSADAVDFTCHADVFKAITGASTGQFPVSFKPVDCDVASDRGVATILDGNNAYFTKAIFSDLPHAVASAQIKVDGVWFSMSRLGGATFVSSLSGGQGGVSFKLTLSDGSTASLNSCFSSWPVSTGSSCTPGGSSPRPTPAPSPPSPKPAVCTAWNKDPYATGAHVSCCDGLQEGLGNWDGDGNIYYKCRQATISMAVVV